MLKQLFIIAVALTILTGTTFASETIYKITPDSVEKHIAVLAHDSLEGRQVGEIGEWKAAQYIKGIFQSIGLDPKGDDGTYLQSCIFIKRIDLGAKNRLTVNGVELEIEEEFLPMLQSASTSFDFSEVVWVDYGIKMEENDGSYDDYENKEVDGKAILIKRFAPSSEDNPHIDFEKYESLTNKINTAIKLGAAGIFFITPENEHDTLMAAGPARINPKDIPIVLLRRKGLKKLGLDLNKPLITSATGETELVKTRDTAYNVVGYMPGSTDSTIIIGAHYDHLGWGSSASLYTGKEPMIHNGADDNGSGTSAILELARHYASRSEQLNHSILFITFSGEEEGLIGSKYFASHMTIDSSKVRMMINLDMIGRMEQQEDGLVVFGVGTCEAFKNYFDSLSYDDIKLTVIEGGIGPSDHTAFYNRKIPVMFFFTGAHEDYHKPSDDIDKIDFDGIVRVSRVVTDAIDYFDSFGGELAFQKTKNDGASKRRGRYSVTFGIMPDYVYEGDGLRADGVIPDRPGDKAGMLDGDVVVKMGKYDIGDIYDYMNALGKFRKGDTCAVIVDRNGEQVSLQVVFE